MTPLLFLFSSKMWALQQLTEEARRNVIGEFYKIHWNKGKTYTVNHFLAMNVPRRTIYAVLRRCDEGVTLARKAGSGRPAVKMPKHRVQALRK